MRAAHPSEVDPTVRSLTEGTGGLPGRHAAVRGWWTPLRIVLAVVTITFGLAVLQKAPCIEQGWDRQSFRPFQALCYSDIGFLYEERGFGQGRIPYLQSGNYPALEYPVLTGAFMEVGAQVTYLITGHPNEHTSAADMRSDASTFFVVNVAMLFLCALALVLLTALTARGSPGRVGGGSRGQPLDALYVAAAPSLAATALINWDLFAVMLTAGAMFAWSRRHPVLFGVLIGIGTAAKFYPFLLLGPLLIVCFRRRRLRDWLFATVAAVVAWVVVNAPFVIFAFNQWKVFWTYNNGREGDYGSIWYVFKLAGYGFVDHSTLLNVLSVGVLVLLCLGVAFVGLSAPRTPRFAQLAFLTVGAFLLINKVYSPQYVLWLLPLVALCRPRLRDWIIWQGCEMFYWALIWPHLAGYLNPGGSNVDHVYWFSVGVRLAGLLYLMIQVCRDIYAPSRDLVRLSDDAEDPAGGVLVPRSGPRLGGQAGHAAQPAYAPVAAPRG